MGNFAPVYPDRELTLDRLKYLVRYDPVTGDFTRLISTSGRAMAGTKCGDVDSKGYWRLRVDGRRYLAHRLAWFYMTGEWPNGEVDHENLKRIDNRWKNLRLADEFLNKRNTGAKKNNKVGFKGVSWHVCSKKWRSRIYLDGKEVNLGLFDTPEDANAAYMVAATARFGEFARAA